MTSAGAPRSRATHWDGVYDRKPIQEVSWFQAEPLVSLRLVAAVLPHHGSVVDVGSGASTLVDALLEQGLAEVTVLDVSAAALAMVQTRLAAANRAAELVLGDVLTWQPQRRYDVWHDRAVFHFLSAPADRAAYAERAAAAVAPGGAAVLGTFAPDGPQSCSGLPTVRYDGPALAAALGPSFVLEHTQREDHRTPAGVVQPFTWVVLRRAGR